MKVFYNFGINQGIRLKKTLSKAQRTQGTSVQTLLSSLRQSRSFKIQVKLQLCFFSKEQERNTYIHKTTLTYPCNRFDKSLSKLWFHVMYKFDKFCTNSLFDLVLQRKQPNKQQYSNSIKMAFVLFRHYNMAFVLFPHQLHGFCFVSASTNGFCFVLASTAWLSKLA